MTPPALQQYLHAHIPLSKAMSVSVVSVEPESVTLSAPLQPNINHRETVFGGSASALAILAAWCLIQTRLSAEGIAARLVIQENTMSYDNPIAGEFLAVSQLDDPQGWERFKTMLRRKGKGRVSVRSDLVYESQIAGRFKGEFVALG
ncbi:YiiD C-terminal domain-containing protein [Rhodoferax sp. GW822-FHT02A01]|uniref:YiiD C-terminal domain-containing protein n=1 Tax=Rhodoferax sp. GW822-FHT02A01 TaxID=3141537 RepID=UPI00315D20DF